MVHGGMEGKVICAASIGGKLAFLPLAPVFRKGGREAKGTTMNKEIYPAQA